MRQTIFSRIFDRFKSKKPKSLKQRLAAWKLHPDVLAAFVAALTPVKRRDTPSVMGRTSEGKNWYPRIGRMLTKDSDRRWLTLCGFRVDSHGNLVRLRPDRDKSVSPRQAKRARTARLRFATA